MLLLIKFGPSLKHAVWFLSPYDGVGLYGLVVGPWAQDASSLCKDLKAAIDCSSNWLLINCINSSTGKLCYSTKLSKLLSVYFFILCFSLFPVLFFTSFSFFFVNFPPRFYVRR